MTNKMNNEVLVKDSNQSQIEEFYNKMNEKEVMNLTDVMNYDWVKDIDSKEESYNQITDSGRFVIWEFPDSETPIDMIFSYQPIEDSIGEVILKNQNESVDEIVDIIVNEYLDEIENHVEQQLVHSYRDVDISNISNYFVGEQGNMYNNVYDDYVKEIKFNFLDKIVFMVSERL